MFVVTNRIPVKPEYREQFEESFRRRAGLVDRMPGFIRNEVWRAIGSNDYLVTTYWANEESFNAWTQSEAFQRAHGGGGSREMYAGAPTLEKYEVIQSTE